PPAPAWSPSWWPCWPPSPSDPYSRRTPSMPRPTDENGIERASPAPDSNLPIPRAYRGHLPDLTEPVDLSTVEGRDPLLPPTAAPVAHGNCSPPVARALVHAAQCAAGDRARALEVELARVVGWIEAHKAACPSMRR